MMNVLDANEDFHFLRQGRHVVEHHDVLTVSRITNNYISSAAWLSLAGSHRPLSQASSVDDAACYS